MVPSPTPPPRPAPFENPIRSTPTIAQLESLHQHLRKLAPSGAEKGQDFLLRGQFIVTPFLVSFFFHFQALCPALSCLISLKTQFPSTNAETSCLRRGQV